MRFQTGLLLGLFLCCTTDLQGQSEVALEWDPPLNSVPAGYRVYYGPSTRHYTNSVDAGPATSVRVCCLVPGATYFFASTAYKADGEESAPSAEFVYRVPDPNALSLSAVPDVVLLPKSVGTVSFNVRLGRTSLSDLDIGVVSSNPGFLPESNIVVSASGTNFTVKLLPRSSVLGSAAVTVTAKDSRDPSRSASEQFGVSVTSLETASTMNAIGNRSIAEDSAAQTVVLSGIGSPVTKAGGTLKIVATSSNPSLIPHPNVKYSSPASSASLTFAPMPNVSGLATITVALKDLGSGITLVTRTFNVSVWEVNDAPTLSALPNLGLPQNAPRQVVGLSGVGSGAPNESQSLVVSAASSNPALIPHPTLNYTSPGAVGTLSFTPVANASGTATITVTVSDGQSFNSRFSRSFTILITSSDATPTLDPIPNRSVAEDCGPQTVNLARIAAANGNANLRISAVSSNPSLIPHPQVNYLTPATSGTLTFAPASDATGSAKITVTVDDGRGLPSSKLARTFTVSVWDVNDPPTLNSLTNLSLPSNPGPQTVALQGITAGAGNESQLLRVTATSSDSSLIPNPKVTYTSPSTSGLLTFTPVPGAAGTATLTVRVDDGQGFNSVTTRSFAVILGSAPRYPSIDPIPDQLLAEDSGPQTVAFLVRTPNGRGGGFGIAATSSNPALISSLDVAEIDENGLGSLMFRSAPEASGVASIRLVLDDGKDTPRSLVTNTFEVVVSEVNDPPTMNPISNRTITLDSQVHTVPLAGIGSGGGDEFQPVVITAISSDPSCIPDPLVRYASPSTTGSLILTPVPNTTGSSTITVMVNDGQSTNNLLTRIFNVKVNAPAGTPTIDPIPGVRIPEDSDLQTLLLTGISSPFGPGAPTVSVVASSSNPELISDPMINYVSGSTQARLTFKPLPNAVGLTIISVTVQDSLDPGNLAVTSFAVSVWEVNDPPAFDAIADLSVAEDSGVQVISITGIGAGARGEVQPLSFRAVSSNPSVVPHPEVSLTAGSNVGSLRLSALPDAWGTAVITVTADDRQSLDHLATRSFLVTVTPENDPPTLDPVADLVMEEDAAFQSIPLTGISSGALTEADLLTVTVSSSDPSVIPDPTIVYESPGAGGILLLAPATDAFGKATIRITVSDGHSSNGQVTRSFQVTVNSVDDPPTLDAVQDVIIEEDFPTSSLTLTGIGAGAPNELDRVSIKATSSNPRLIPDPTVTYQDGDAEASLSFSPAPDEFGAAVIEVEVEVVDGLSPASRITRSFSIQVNPANDSPTLNELPDLVMFSDSGPVTIELTGLSSGAANEPDVVTISAVSTDPALLLDPQVSYANPNSVGTLRFTPLAQGSGVAQILLAVDDGQPERGLIQRAFTVTVLRPPTNALWIEAEAGVLEEPMTLGSHTNASAGGFVFSPAADQGAVSFALDIPRTANYVLWALIQPPDLATQLFTASFDGAAAFQWSTTNVFVSASPQWIRADLASEGGPLLFHCDAGVHTLRLRAGQENVILDAIYLTTDRAGLPPGLEGQIDPEYDVDTLPPYPWISSDVGLPPIPGSARFQDRLGTFNIRGSGSIGGSADHFHFLYQTLSGDGVITAKLSSVRGSGAEERVGLMMRQDLVSGSPYVFLGTSGQDDLVLQSRDMFGAESSANLWELTAPPELWVQLSREGETVYAFAQIDGVAWHLVSILTVPLGTDIYFGMAVASEDPQNLALPSFSGVIAAP